MWTWPPTVRSTPRPTTLATTRRTTPTTPTTEATVWTVPASTPQYIHFYERPQISDLPEQPDFYHVYNNEVTIIQYLRTWIPNPKQPASQPMHCNEEPALFVKIFFLEICPYIFLKICPYIFLQPILKPILQPILQPIL